MSEIPLAETPRIGKILDLVCEKVKEKTVEKLKDSLAESPSFERTWADEGPRKMKWKLTKTLGLKRESELDANALILVRFALKNYPFSSIVGLIRGVTIENMLYLPSNMEFGTIIDGSIPAGIRFFNKGWGNYSIDLIPNRSDSPLTPNPNPFAELIYMEGNRMYESDSKLVKAMHDIKGKESWQGVPGWSGRQKKYRFQFPRILTAIPYGEKILLSVSAAVKTSWEQRIAITEMGREVKVKIVAPSMDELYDILRIFSIMTEHVKQVAYDIPTYGDFQSKVLEMPGILIADLEESG